MGQDIAGAISMRNRFDAEDADALFLTQAEGDTRYKTLETATAPTYQNAWANYGGAYTTAGYFKSPEGLVRFQGAIAGGNSGSTAFTLPVGYRPAGSSIFIVSDGTTATVAVVNISSAGEVVVNSAQANPQTYISLEGVEFRAA